MNDKPSYTTWKRRQGGSKVCPECKHRHAPVMRIDGKSQRVKVCIKCGADLPSSLTYPRKGAVVWTVREFNPRTGRTRDFACESKEDADELILRKKRDYTADPVQEALIEKVSVLCREIQVTNLDDAVHELIEKLGGDPTSRRIQEIGIDAAIDAVCGELQRRDLASDSYVTDVRRTAQDFASINSLDTWSEVTADSVRSYARTIAAGGWGRDGRRVKPVGPRTVKRCLATIRSFVSRAVANGWIHPAIQGDASIWAQAVEGTEHAYMSDVDFQLLMGKAESSLMQTLILTAYNTAARRADLLGLRWSDVDLDGLRFNATGWPRPIVRIANNKGNRKKRKRPLIIPLYSVTVEALEQLRQHPEAITHVRCPLTDRAIKTDDKDRNRWTFHDLRRKANDDIGRAGASIREQMELTGHRSVAVNVAHYQTADSVRMRELVGNLSGFRGLKIAK